MHMASTRGERESHTVPCVCLDLATASSRDTLLSRFHPIIHAYNMARVMHDALVQHTTRMCDERERRVGVDAGVMHVEGGTTEKRVGTQARADGTRMRMYMSRLAPHHITHTCTCCVSGKRGSTRQNRCCKMYVSWESGNTHTQTQD